MDIATEYVLEWVNQVRTARDLAPLEYLPRGRRCVPNSCPIALSLAELGGQGFNDIWVDTAEGVVFGSVSIEMPKHATLWARAFDKGWYPDYQLAT